MMDEYTSFDEWFRKEGFYENQREDLMRAWNAGIVAVCDYFGAQEGTTYRAEEKFLVSED
jgi:hypothetical protein